jgi:hypothetical protein
MLGLDGYVFEEIEEVGERCPLSEEMEEHVRGGSNSERVLEYYRMIVILDAWREVAMGKSGGTYVTGEPIQDCYCRTVCSGYAPDGEELMRHDFKRWDRDVAACARWIKRLRLDLSDGGVRSRLKSAVVQLRSSMVLAPGTVWRFHKNISFLGRRICRTKSGFIGLAPQYAQPGDVVALVKGGRLPLVLRRAGEHWRLLGEAYVDGIMGGEYWDEKRCTCLWIV